MSIQVLSAEFVKGVVRPTEREEGSLPEVAVAGRSNVGKSSFVNTVLGKKGLARVSNTPGRTREINLYSVTLVEAGTQEQIMLADLPGFGYAKLSKTERNDISRMSVEYLRSTPSLRAVALLVDSKRLPEEDEAAIVRVCAEEGIHFLVIATKIDRLGQSERTKAVREISRALGLEPQDILVSGTGKFDPRENFWSRLRPLLDESAA